MARIFFRPTTNVLPTGKHVIISTFPRIFFAFAMVLLVGLSISDAFSIPAPDGLSYFPFQVEAIQENLVRSNGILLGDEMGLGKTISVIGAMMLSIINCFIDYGSMSNCAQKKEISI